MNKRIAYIWLFLVPLIGCSKHPADSPDEDYDKLFPFTGIEKPVSDGSLSTSVCNPERELADYAYSPENIEGESREYIVTVRYGFRETDYRGELSRDVSSRYIIRYIDANGKYISVGSGSSAPIVMANGKEYSETMRVRSGYPLYLSLIGSAPRGSSVRASISAHSTDGFITAPTINIEQYQNDEGIHTLKHPFCEYIILP